jgi:hypothetical protein
MLISFGGGGDANQFVCALQSIAAIAQTSDVAAAEIDLSRRFRRDHKAIRSNDASSFSAQLLAHGRRTLLTLEAS